jgi:hypothetical protein
MKLILIFFVAGAAVGYGRAFQTHAERPATPEIRRLGQEWSTSSRTRDPIGFLEHVRRSVDEDRDRLQAGQERLELVRYRANQELESSREFLESAEQLGDECRSAFQRAEAEDQYPIEVDGTVYERDELIEQTKQTLLLTECFDEILPEYESLLVEMDSAEDDIERCRVQTDDVIEEIEAQRKAVWQATELPETDRAGTDRVVEKAEQALTQNVRAVSKVARRIPQFDEMLKQARFSRVSSDEDMAKVLEFLKKSGAKQAD